MRKPRLLLVMLVLAACTRQPSPQELAQKFHANPDAFERLRALVQEDTGSRDCFVVGIDNIGDYWRHQGQWAAQQNHEKKLGLPEVLDAVGLSSARYEQYMSAFSASGAERISFCKTGHLGPWTSILIYRAGLSVSGCTGSVDWRETAPGPEDQRGDGDFAEITPLDGGWYLEFRCT